jgi:ribulose-5-phosphate 4-epimerase/fuculose-1-phosphate aldolase
MTVAVAERTAYTTKQAKIDLAAAHRLVVRQGLKDLGLGNHFTLVDPESPGRLISTPEYESWVLVTASNLTVIESEEQAAADPKLWINYRIHWPIHQAREDAACVLHVHPPYLTALSMIDDTLGRAHQGMTFLEEKVAYTQEYDGAVGHKGMEQGQLAAEALGDTKIALIMRNHGVLVVGPSVAHAYVMLCALETQAQYRILALSTGRPLHEVPDEAMPDRENFGRPPKQQGDAIDQKWANFEAQKRVLDRFEPDYRD